MTIEHAQPAGMAVRADGASAGASQPWTVRRVHQKAAALTTAKVIVSDKPWSLMTRDADFKAELLRMIE